VAPHTVFVNVEPEVLDSAPLSALLTIADAAPEELRVVLEITERALAVRPAELLRTVERVRDLGWGVALDDVGADSASLALMALLRPGVLKLDLSLIQDRPSPAVAEIMHAVNAYAERSGALVLAEGIETDRHLAAARALGATSGRGGCSVARPPTRTRPLPCTPSTCPSSTASRTGRRSARPSPACPPTWC
jgi:EAL domain-containing protein (putative c-di-GMP-specific phosphodiesterase class I)